MSTSSIRRFDITSDDSTTGYEGIDREIDRFMEGVKGDTHTIDLAPFDVGRDKHELWEEKRTELRQSRHRTGKYAGGVLLAGYSTVATVHHVKATPPADLLSPDALLRLAQTFVDVVWSELSGFVAGLIAIFYVFIHGMGYLNTRSRALALRAKEVLEKDKRRPVLMIRSFLDDTAPIYGLSTRMVRGQDGKERHVTEIATSRFEEALAPVISRLGPLVAVGNPREELPQLGAARARFSNEQWKEPVIQMLDQSRVILLVSGIKPGSPEEHTEALRRGDLLSVLQLTPGVRWEVDRIMSSDLRSKLLVVFKPNPLDSSGKAAVEKAFNMQGDVAGVLFTPARESPELIYLEDLVGLRIAPDGRIGLVESKKRIDTVDDYTLGIRILVHDMLCGPSAGPPSHAAT